MKTRIGYIRLHNGKIYKLDIEEQYIYVWSEQMGKYKHREQIKVYVYYSGLMVPKNEIFVDKDCQIPLSFRNL